MAVKPIPEGYHSITPYLITRDARAALEFYKKVFDAKEIFIMEHDGKVGHGEMKIGDSQIMFADEFPEMNNNGPEGLSRYSALMLYVNDVDSVYKKAIDNGCKVIKELKNEFYGDRMATIMDPFGHKWYIGTHVEDVTPEEMEKRAKSANK